MPSLGLSFSCRGAAWTPCSAGSRSLQQFLLCVVPLPSGWFVTSRDACVALASFLNMKVKKTVPDHLKIL